MKKLPFLFFFLIVLASCSEDEEPIATIKVNPVNTTTNAVDGDVTGNGGSASRTFTWDNSRPTAEYNMDMTVSGGSFQMIIKDAAGTVVLDYTLVKGQTADSKSGVSASGVSGTWTIEVHLKNFNGSGSYDLSQGT